jgi:spore coat polysaccharide biosynthesis protein SpsF
MKTVVILQARMSSSRLPGKILMDLAGKTVIERVIDRLYTFTKLDDLIVATTDSFKDDITCELLDKFNIKYFRGSENNVLERYYLCAKENNATQIIRATADDPLSDISLLEYMFTSHIISSSDYTFSTGYPIGVQEEIVTFSSLEQCYNKSTKDNHFEHVLEYIVENEDEFIINNIIANKEINRKDVRVTLDTCDDYDVICEYYNNIGNINSITTTEIIKYWDYLHA